MVEENCAFGRVKYQCLIKNVLRITTQVLHLRRNINMRAFYQRFKGLNEDNEI